jgi:Flp pilus assembly CpaF family ATPase
MAMFDRDLASLLGAAVRAKRNIVVAGPMGAGKTTLLRALASEIPRAERLVTIEQAFELALEASGRHPNMVAVEAREANTEGEGEITMRQLVRRSLRMNADRVIVGEVLGDEILAMLNAMSQGRSGSMCTIHADSSAGVFRRIAAYAVQAPERLPLEAANLLAAGALHFVVYISMRRGPAGTERFVSSVREVIDAEGPMVISNEVWRPGPDGRAVPGIPLRSETAEELLAFGHAPRMRSLA